MIGDDGAGFAGGRRRNGFCRAFETERSKTFPLEIVLITFDLLLLAVHQVKIVAKKQVQILVPVAGQLLFYGLELE